MDKADYIRVELLAEKARNEEIAEKRKQIPKDRRNLWIGIGVCMQTRRDTQDCIHAHVCTVAEANRLGIPVIAVVGKNEAEAGTVAIRRLGSQAQEVVSLDEAIRILTEEATPPDLRPA